MTSVDRPGYGIAALGHALGRPVEVAPALPADPRLRRMIRSWGYQRFHRADDGHGLTDLAEQAARIAIDRSGVDPSTIDLVVLAIADIAEHLYWDPAAALQGRLGADRAEALLLSQACGSGVMAFDVVAGKFATHPDYEVALVVAANRVCESYCDRMTVNATISSDGAAAALLLRGHPACRWLTTKTITDGQYANVMRLDSGGTARPFADGRPGPRVASLFDRLTEFFGTDKEAMVRFATATRDRTREVVERACQSAGVRLADVSWLIHLNDGQPALAELARLMDIPPHRTNARIAAEYGHLGPADQLLGLERLLTAGELPEGELVALTSTGSGAHWVCTLLRI